MRRSNQTQLPSPTCTWPMKRRAMACVPAGQGALAGVVLGVAAQPADEHVHAAVEGPRLAALSQLQELIAGERAIGVEQQRLQQPVLGLAQRHHPEMSNFYCHPGKAGGFPIF